MKCVKILSVETSNMEISKFDESLDYLKCPILSSAIN